MTGQRVGSYEIVRVLARGGMAVVYLARQPALGRDVALKRVDLDSRDPMIAHRFVREAQLAGALAHPNIVTVYDFLEAEGVPYIAMEYVAGGSLRPHVGKLDRAQVFGVLDGVLAGLDHAEGHGVAHRDLKPENVLVTPRGAVKLADFGIARAYSALTQRLTSTGLTAGTPTYMAPEQAMNESLSPCTDLYAVGVIAYELLAGRPPFEAADTPLAVLYKHVNEPPPPLTGLAPDVPKPLCEWVEWLLQKQPSDRPGSAEQASESLERLAVEELGPFWRRQAPIVAASGTSTAEWTTYRGDTPQAPPVAEPAATPPPAPRPEPTPAPPQPEPTPPSPPQPQPEPPEPQPQPTPPPLPQPEPPEPQPEPTPPPPEPEREPAAATLPPTRAIPEPGATAVLPPPAAPAARPANGRRNALLAAVAALAAAAVGAVLLLGSDDPGAPGPGPAPGRPDAAIAYDFDGDGRQEPVVGTPDAGGGAIFVLEPEPRRITPADAGLTGRAAQFGASLASGDFDGDGRADLAIGARDPGAVTILYGGEQGLRRDGRQTFRGDSPRYGSALAAGDLDGDGRDDLVIGAPGEQGPGALEVRLGGADGLGDSGRPIAPPAGAERGFGARARLGDVNGDGSLDVIESGSARAFAPGHTTFCAGSDSGPESCARIDAPGGTALAVGDVDGDGLADVVQGDVGPDPEAVAGEVRVLKGGPEGPEPEPLVITQQTARIPGNDQIGDEFGGTVSVAKIDGDRFADIVVGAPGEDGVGKVTVVRGGPDGHARKGHRRTALPEPRAGSVFGKAVTVLDLEGDGEPVLIVAAAVPDGIRLLPFAAANGELEPGEPIDLDGAGGSGDPVEVSVRLGRAAGG